jgi:hypothetical protein
LRNDVDGIRSIESEMSINFLSLSSDGLPLRSASNTEPVPRNFSISLRTALRWGTDDSEKFSANCSYTKSVYLLPSRNTYSTRKTRSSIERTTVSKNSIKQLHTSPVLHFNRCLTSEYSETTTHFNDNFDTDIQSTYRSHSDIPNALYIWNTWKGWKCCGGGEGWKRSVGPVLQEIKYYTERRRREISYRQ